ncbi:MAG TPA: tetratricopeptide repeat protein, partial [bacterium]
GRRTRAARGALVAAAAAAGLAFSAATVAQQAVWKDSLSLWDAVIEREPLPLAFAYHNRAVALARGGRIGEAIADYGRANAIDPGDARVLVNRGLLLVQTGRIGDAVADFRAACDLGNDFACRAAEVYRAGGAPFPGRPRD